MKELDENITIDYEKIDRFNRIRKSPLRKELLIDIFSSKNFVRELNFCYNKIRRHNAEAGFIAYEKLRTGEFFLSRKWGVGAINPENPDWMFRSDPNPHIYTKDNKRYMKGGFVRIGDLHIHPSGASLFSEGDVDNYDETYLKPTGFYPVGVPKLFEGFRMIAGVNHKPKHELEIFGASLPYGRLKGTEYQGRVFRNSKEHDKILRKCGFRVVRTSVPVIEGKVVVRQSAIDELVKLSL